MISILHKHWTPSMWSLLNFNDTLLKRSALEGKITPGSEVNIAFFLFGNLIDIHFAPSVTKRHFISVNNVGDGEKFSWSVLIFPSKIFFEEMTCGCFGSDAGGQSRVQMSSVKVTRSLMLQKSWTSFYGCLSLLLWEKDLCLFLPFLVAAPYLLLLC